MIIKNRIELSERIKLRRVIDLYKLQDDLSYPFLIVYYKYIYLSNLEQFNTSDLSIKFKELNTFVNNKLSNIVDIIELKLVLNKTIDSLVSLTNNDDYNPLFDYIFDEKSNIESVIELSKEYVLDRFPSRSIDMQLSKSLLDIKENDIVLSFSPTIIDYIEDIEYKKLYIVDIEESYIDFSIDTYKIINELILLDMLGLKNVKLIHKFNILTYKDKLDKFKADKIILKRRNLTDEYINKDTEDELLKEILALLSDINNSNKYKFGRLTETFNYALNHLTKDGLMVVSDSGIVLSSSRYYEVRADLIKNRLIESVVSAARYKNNYILISKKEKEYISFVEIKNEHYYRNSIRDNGINQKIIDTIVYSIENQEENEFIRVIPYQDFDNEYETKVIPLKELIAETLKYNNLEQEENNLKLEELESKIKEKMSNVILSLEPREYIEKIFEEYEKTKTIEKELDKCYSELNELFLNKNIGTRK